PITSSYTLSLHDALPISVSHGFNQHGGGTKQMLMARPPLREDGANEYPVIGSVVSKVRESRMVGLPNYILCSDEGALTNPHQSSDRKSTRLNSSHDQISY